MSIAGIVCPLKTNYVCVCCCFFSFLELSSHGCDTVLIKMGHHRIIIIDMVISTISNSCHCCKAQAHRTASISSSLTWGTRTTGYLWQQSQEAVGPESHPHRWFWSLLEKKMDTINCKYILSPYIYGCNIWRKSSLLVHKFRIMFTYNVINLTIHLI